MKLKPHPNTKIEYFYSYANFFLFLYLESLF